MRLPPYGTICEERKPSNSAPAMSDWPSDIDFKKFLDEIGDDIATYIWPRYCASGGKATKDKWIGDAKEFAEAASVRDIELCIEHFFPRETQDILDDYPETPLFNLEHGMPQNHLWHFRAEDFGVGGIAAGLDTTVPDNFELAASVYPYTSMVYYQPELNVETIRRRVLLLSSKKTSGLFSLKMDFQRPRPHQVAFIAGLDEFRCHYANRYTHAGLHPSLPSGHCFQGVLISCGVVEQLLASGQRDGFEGLSRYAVDAGDRRVYGGIHYITDNVASWCICLKLIPNIFNKTDQDTAFILKFALDAIHQSKVYQVLRDHGSQNGQGLEKAMTMLSLYRGRAAEHYRKLSADRYVWPDSRDEPFTPKFPDQSAHTTSA